MDRDDTNVISHLYFAATMPDTAARQMLHCYGDTKVPLSGTGVVLIENGNWELAPGVVSFLKLAEASLASFPPKDWIFGSPLRDPLATPALKPTCFLAAPYGPAWFEQVRDSVGTAADDAGYDFKVALDIAVPGSVMTQVWNSVRAAQVVVADLTGLNANVMYEVGVAHALGKFTILITQHSDQLPFDVGGMRWHAYDLSSLGALKGSLQKSLTEIQTICRLPVL